MGPQHVEANSLSDIIQLASNPPKYPRNPTETARKSLTLYIARVPGSNDIILTTLKPQLKNVTAEDVASSLYYLHLDTEDDARLLTEEEGSEAEALLPMVIEKPLPRKPLPESAKSSLDLQRYHLIPPASETVTALHDYDIAPTNTPSQKLTSDSVQSPLAKTVSVPRKPLGPRAFTTEPAITRKPLPAPPRSEDQPFSAMVQTESPIPRSSSYSISPAGSNVTTTNSTSFFPGGDEETQSSKQSATEFSITLIRRDPSSGGQWNIGKIIGQPVPDEPRDRGTKSRSELRKCYYTMFIHITTPGYNWFRNPQVTHHTGKSSAATQNLIDPASPTAFERSSSKTSEKFPISQSGFDRQVWMERSNFWDRPFKHQRQESLEISGLRGAANVRSSSDESGVEVPATMLNDMGSLDLNGSPANGYVFKSLWGGKCTFSTGGGGRNLRCKHTLPDITSANNSSGSLSSQSSAAVSELRFNLPSSAIFKASVAPSERESDNARFLKKVGHIRNKLSFDKKSPLLPPRSHLTSYAAMYPSDEEDPRLDLSIGQEKAGGGNRGKRAKLGKLIIHDEGLKMIDLVVAANMSVWWSVWEQRQR